MTRSWGQSIPCGDNATTHALRVGVCVCVPTCVCVLEDVKM